MNWYNKIITAGLSAWDQKDFIKKLKKEYGVVFYRKGKGDDQIWGIPEKNIQTSIPVSSGSTTINPYTMTKILKNLQIPLADFYKRSTKKKEKRNVAPVETTDTTQEVTNKIEDWQKPKWLIEQEKRMNEWNNGEKQASWNSLPGGRADGKTPSDFNDKSIEKGKEIELEHTDDKDLATEITMDHLAELPDYYDEEKGLPAMERKLEKTKDARGLYNQPQGDSYNQNAGEEALNDWLVDFKDELAKMKIFAKQGRFNDMAEYREQLAKQGYPLSKIDGLMSAAMHGIKL